MLVKLHKIAPGRHQLRKGYVLSRPDLAAELKQFAARSPAFRDAGIELQIDPRRARRLWFDTGPVWVHSREARQKVRTELATAVSEVAQKVRAMGGALLPNAVRPDRRTDWRDWFVADIHRVEVGDDFERVQLCNELRQQLPLLVAISARAGVEGSTAGRVGSKRLALDRSLIPARPFPFFSEAHLARLRRYYRERMGTPRLEQLEVCPLNGRSPRQVDAAARFLPSIACNFLDGQVLISSAMAHVVLLQALAMRIRRTVQRNPFSDACTRRFGSDAAFAEARAAAIVDGIRTSFRVESQDAFRPEGRADRPGFRSALDEFLTLCTGLADELRILEAGLDEMQGLLTGSIMRIQGVPACVVENDVLSSWARGKSADAGGPGLVARIQDVLCDTRQLGADHTGAINRAEFPREAMEAEEFWTNLLQLRGLSDAELLTERTAARSRAGDRAKPPKAQGPRQPQMGSSNPLFLLLRDLMEAAPEVHATILADLARRLGRRNWRDWMRSLPAADRDNLKRQLGLPDRVPVYAGPESWQAEWAESLRAEARSSGWSAVTVLLEKTNGAELEDSVRSFFEQAPADLYAICLDFEESEDTKRQSRTHVIVLNNAGAA